MKNKRRLWLAALASAVLAWAAPVSAQARYPGKPVKLVLTDLVGGNVQLAFLDMSIAIPQIKAGKLRALATTGKDRTPKLFDLPTMSEAGLTGYAIDVWFGMLAPAGTPPDVVERLNAELQQVLPDPGLKQRMRDIGQELQASSTEDFGRFVRTELKRMGDIVRASNATMTKSGDTHDEHRNM